MRETLATWPPGRPGRWVGRGRGLKWEQWGGGGVAAATRASGDVGLAPGSSPDLSTARGRDYLRCGGRAPAALLQGLHPLRHSSNELALQSSDFRSQRASSGSSVGTPSPSPGQPRLSGPEDARNGGSDE